MPTLNPGDLAIIKTSEEPVFVLGKATNVDNYEGLSGLAYLVRRPVLTSEGTKHIIESFYAEELETESERQDRIYAAFRSRVGKSGLANTNPEQLPLIS